MMRLEREVHEASSVSAMDVVKIARRTEPFVMAAMFVIAPSAFNDVDGLT